MKIYSKADLHFEKIEGNAPDFTCNFCGTRRPGNGMLMASLQITEDSEFSVVVCDHECMVGIMSAPHTDDYINDTIERIMTES